MHGEVRVVLCCAKGMSRVEQMHRHRAQYIYFCCKCEWLPSRCECPRWASSHNRCIHAAWSGRIVRSNVHQLCAAALGSS
eukprot:3643732-Amphidinium_carterae.1